MERGGGEGGEVGVKRSRVRFMPLSKKFSRSGCWGETEVQAGFEEVGMG